MNRVPCRCNSGRGSAEGPALPDHEIVYFPWRHGIQRKDGDLVMLTDNKVLVERMRELPALMCIQRKAEKKIVTEQDAIRSNIDSFGDDIGKTTNWITSMFDVQAQFPKDSREYKELDYRIMCGQLYQQNAICKVVALYSNVQCKTR